MSEARAMPVLGALLGALLGLVSMALLTVLGVLAPDRLPLFGLVGVGLVLGSALLTQRLANGKKRLVASIVIGAIVAGVALTGIPEIVRGGSVSAGCMITGTSSLEPEPVAPADTSAVDAFSVTTRDTVEWTTQTNAPVTAATGTLSLLVGGFKIPVRNLEFVEAPEITTWSGQTAVSGHLDAIQDASSLAVTGTYHAAASVDADQGECTGDAYVRVAPDGAVDGLLLVLLWTVLGVLVIALIALTVVVRRSIRESDRTLAMVGTSAIPGETSTQAPISSPSPAGQPDTGEQSDATSDEAPLRGPEEPPRDAEVPAEDESSIDDESLGEDQSLDEDQSFGEGQPPGSDPDKPRES